MYKSTVLIVLTMLWMTPAWSCSCTDTSFEYFIKNADSVLVARITNVALKKASTEDADDMEYPFYVKAKYDLIELMQGEKPDEQVLIDGVHMLGACTTGLIAGWYYVIFLDESYEISYCNGSLPIGALEWQDAEYYLETLENIKQYKSLNKENIAQLPKQSLVTD